MREDDEDDTWEKSSTFMGLLGGIGYVMVIGFIKPLFLGRYVRGGGVG